MGDPTLVVSDEPLAAAAAHLCRVVRERVAERGFARLAIPGGSVAAVVAPARKALGDAWHSVRLTWVDERCVAFDSPESNRGQAHRSGALSREHPPAIELALFLDGELAAEAPARVEAALRERFESELDVVLLGMGPDGHVASLFPGRSSGGGLVVHVSDSPKPPADRITLTRDLLLTAQSTILVATGEQKRWALFSLLRGEKSLPAHGLPGLVVFTDLNVDGEKR